MPQVCAFEGLKRESIRAGRPNPRVGKWPPGVDAGRPYPGTNRQVRNRFCTSGLSAPAGRKRVSSKTASASSLGPFCFSALRNGPKNEPAIPALIGMSKFYLGLAVLALGALVGAFITAAAFREVRSALLVDH